MRLSLFLLTKPNISVVFFVLFYFSWKLLFNHLFSFLSISISISISFSFSLSVFFCIFLSSYSMFFHVVFYWCKRLRWKAFVPLCPLAARKTALLLLPSISPSISSTRPFWIQFVLQPKRKKNWKNWKKKWKPTKEISQTFSIFSFCIEASSVISFANDSHALFAGPILGRYLLCFSLYFFSAAWNLPDIRIKKETVTLYHNC